MKTEKAGYICKVLKEILGNNSLGGNTRVYYLGNPVCTLLKKTSRSRESDLSALYNIVMDTIMQLQRGREEERNL